MKERNHADDNIRQEILASEEQRSYIEVLKQALEARIEELGLKTLLQQALSKPKRPKHLNTSIDIFAELAHLKKNEINAKKHASRAESTITDLEVEVQNLRERIRSMTTTIEELHTKSSKSNRELEETLKICDGMRNDLVVLEEERNKLLVNLDLLNKSTEDATQDNRSLNITLSRLEAKLNDQYKQNENFK